MIETNVLRIELAIEPEMLLAHGVLVGQVVQPQSNHDISIIL